MARRRLGHLAKMAVSVADAALASARSADIPIVWASRYGDAAKSIALLKAQAVDEALSPTAFGLSVHNGVGAQHSILRGMRSNAVCIASSHCAPEAGVVEAVSLLNDAEQGGAEVLLVSYDEPLPPDYTVFHDEPVAEYAWAALLAPLQPGGEGYALRALDDVPPEHGRCDETSALPHGLDVLHFLLQVGLPSLVHSHASGRWIWERVHA